MILSKLRVIFTIIQMAVTISVVIVFMYLFNDKNHKIRQIWAKMQMKLLGIDLDIKGELNSDAQMVVMNHQSVLDIIVMENLHPNNISWIAKKEIADIPWFGSILTLPKMIIVERESKSSLIRLLKEVKNRLKQNRPVAIFPEGTRTDGNKLRKFKAGAKMIAEKFDLTVQPVVLVGTRKILDSQNFTQQSGVVKVIYLPSIKVDKNTNWYKDMEDQMAETLKKELKNDI